MIKSRYHRICRASAAVLCAIALIVPGDLIYAAPDSSELEQKTSELQDDIDTMNDELDALSTKLEDTSSKIKKKAKQIEAAELDLASAKLNEKNHYNAMKERIRFMYEGGSLSLLQILLSSESMADFLNNAEYVTMISDYDRDMLKEFQNIRENVKKKQDRLEKEQNELSKLEKKLNKQQDDLTEKLSETSGQLDDYASKLEEARAAEAAIEAAKNADADTIALLAAILECEAGISYEGMIAVGTVIMNRVGSARFPNSIEEVIYQSGQFSPVRSGKLDEVLQKGPMDSAYKAAKAVLSGERNGQVKKCLFFWASYTGHDGIIVGDNVFW